MRLQPFLLLIAAVASGCAKSRDAVPEDVEGLAGYLFRNWDDPDDLADGMENMADWLDSEGVADSLVDGYVLPDLVADDLMAITYPDDPPLETMIGVGAGAVSPYAIDGHAALIAQEDQRWNEPTYDVYTRTFVEGDPVAFADGTGRVATENAIDKRGGFGVNIPYTLYKDYAWVELSDDRRAIVARSWTQERNCAEGGNNCIDLSFSVDLFYAPVDGETVRLTASWNKLTTVADGLIAEDGLIAQMVRGIGDIMDNTDETLSEDGW